MKKLFACVAASTLVLPASAQVRGVPARAAALSAAPAPLVTPSLPAAPSGVAGFATTASGALRAPESLLLAPALAVPSLMTPMTNDPARPVASAPAAAKPVLEAAAAGAARPAEAAPALAAAFDGAAPHCAACANEEHPPVGGPAASPASSSGRLSEGVRPRRYDLFLSLNPAAGTFSGRAKVSLHAKAATERLTLHALDLTFRAVTVGGKPLDLSKVVVDAKAETVTLVLDAPLQGHAVVEFEYDGKMNELMRGLYKSRGKNGEADEAWSFTHLEPTHARRVLPSFDEPGFKAPFRLTLEVPEGLTPISNMPAVSVQTENGRTTASFAETPKMSSYLLAVFAARLVPTERKVAGTAVRAWTTPAQVAQAKFALDAAEFSLKYLNRYFGLKYQLPKLDMVAAPDFASGAMENWGAILFRDSSLLVDEALSSDAAKKRVAEVVAHEIVHQWFGNLVTMGWWNDLWLNEAFATWLAYKVVDAWKPEWKVWDDFDGGKRAPLSIDSLPGTRPVRAMAATPAEIQAMFDGITYQKGGALLRMIESWLGAAEFRDGVRAYTAKHQYGNAEAGDLARALEAASSEPVARVMNGWLSRGGVPQLSVSASGAGNRTLTISQARFSAFGLKSDDRWAVPVSVRYRLKGERKTRVARVLLEGPKTTLKLPGRGELAWAYPNADETGYYRIALSPDLLAAALKGRKALTALERAGLLNNLWARARAGELPVGAFLEALAPFRDDPSRLVLEDAASYLKALRQELAGDEAGRAALASYASNFFAPAVARLGWDKKNGEPQDAAQTRAAVLGALALLAPDADFEAQVTARLAAYLENPAATDPALAPVVLTAAARRGDAAVFDAFRARLAAPKTPEQKTLMLRALAEFDKPELLDRTLAMTLSEEIRAQDAWMPFVWLLSNPATRERAWEFVKANWTALVAKVGPRGGTRVVGAAAGLTGPERRREVEAFFSDPAREIEMARKTLAQTLETMDLAARFSAAQGPAFAEWARLQSLSPEHAAVGVKAYDRLAGFWALTAAERADLLGLNARSYARLRKDPSLATPAVMERLSLALGVYKRLGGLLPQDRQAAWLRAPNKGLGGRTALALMTRDAAGLREVRDYLQSVGGGWL